MIRNKFYNQLINSETMGFVDPLTDLGEFDSIQLKFKEPVRNLVNKYSGKPYNLNWQDKIEKMRVLYIQYQKSLILEDQEQAIHNRVRNKESKEHVHEIVTTYLKLGFKFKEIEAKVSLFNTRLRRNWKRSDYVTTTSPEFYLKRDLQDGYCMPKSSLPTSMKVN
ncbi:MULTISPECIES: modification methylase Sau96I [unclassified Streptococcus]|uniref:modification methylase Sau96I n=1 Tax=unclassified Streptococcus TaxID=2608887 RepID=UPI00107162D9|nr:MULTISPECIES: modification methylase Sau96I [unclassified Streptococcus]MBF0786971.1 modification methylase Sau96I [Streptococcus sp. 19428wC2_LYSM12]MCQ9211515.1 modification methylase Sau96I [Streptococcus sp. B01]MCQ9214831.1 modification methylase Sau96I [Streptococcus sp. O1]TFV06169.1 modification methylase Sau96I [Streptococcus sp. LYSM12]